MEASNKAAVFAATFNYYYTHLDMGPFLLTQIIQSKPIQSGCPQLTSNPIHKFVMLNRPRKLCATNYSNADF